MDWPVSIAGEAGEMVAVNTEFTVTVTLTQVVDTGAPTLLSVTLTE
jgi:hypothetical protein